MPQLETTFLSIFTAEIPGLLQPSFGRVGWVFWARFLHQHQGTFPLQIKPIVSQYLKQKKLPYNEDTYSSRLRLFLQRYEELMVHAPPITELVGIQ